MKNLLLILFIFISPIVASQQQHFNFCEISKEEMNMSSYARDPEADAVVLFDIGESFFFDTSTGYDIRFSRMKRIKIFNKSATENTEISIPFYIDGKGNAEIVKSIEAYTYNLVGGRIEIQAVDTKSVFEVRINDRWRAKKFVFPNVQDGSILELRYVLETPFHFNLPDWTFQDKIPTIYSEYTVKMIPFYEYQFITQGIKRWDFQDSRIGTKDRYWGELAYVYGKEVAGGIKFQDYIHTFVLKDIPAFKDESYITSRQDYIIKMDFQLSKLNNPHGGVTEIVTTWPKLNSTLLKDERFGKYIKKTKSIAKKILEDELQIKSLNDDEKCKSIINYVKNSFTWDGINSKYAHKTPKELIEQKSGNSAEINLFMIGLLQAADINCYPVILSTRNHGKVKADYPFEHFFNNVIAFIDEDQKFLSDCTERFLAYNRIPPSCVNDLGLIVTNKEADWVSLKYGAASLKRKVLRINISPERLVSNISAQIQSTEYESYSSKKRFGDNHQEIKDYYMKVGINEVSDITTLNYSDPSKPYIIGFTGTSGVNRVADNLIIEPFKGFAVEMNQLKEKDRSYPVDFIYPRSDEFHINIIIPGGYKQIDLPPDYHLDNDIAKINLSYEPSEIDITIIGSYYFKKAVYEPDEYSELKQVLDLIIKKFNDQIVFKKI